MLPDIVSLSLFIQVAETQSITGAAEANHIALAAASRRISALEQQFNVRLFDRTARGVELTHAGRAVLHHARLIISQVEQLRSEVTEYAGGNRGYIRIQANTSAISQNLPADLAAFKVLVPDVAVALQERSSGEIAQALREGTSDIGIVVEGTSMEGLYKAKYITDQLVAVVPRDHPLRGRKVAFFTMLDFDFVGLESNRALTRLLTDRASVANKPLRLRVQVASFASLCKMIEAGFGVGVMPETAARPFATASKLRLITLSDAWASRQMYVCVRDHDALPTTTRKLLDYLTAS